MDEEQLHYATKEEQVHLLELILAASECDMYEDGVLVERAGGSHRRVGSMGSMSGADDSVYGEKRKGSKKEHLHYLFKKFRS